MISRSFSNIALLLVMISFALTGCGYHMTATSSKLLASGQKLWVPFIANESISPSAQTVLRRAIYDECHAMRGLSASASESSADLLLKGKLVSYSNRIASYNSQDHVTEYQLNIEVELELFRSGTEAPVWKGMLRSSKIYPVNANLALQRNSEEKALESAARIIAQKLILAAEQSY